MGGVSPWFQCLPVLGSLKKQSCFAAGELSVVTPFTLVILKSFKQIASRHLQSLSSLGCCLASLWKTRGNSKWSSCSLRNPWAGSCAVWSETEPQHESTMKEQRESGNRDGLIVGQCHPGLALTHIANPGTEWEVLLVISSLVDSTTNGAAGTWMEEASCFAQAAVWDLHLILGEAKEMMSEKGKTQSRLERLQGVNISRAWTSLEDSQSVLS